MVPSLESQLMLVTFSDLLTSGCILIGGMIIGRFSYYLIKNRLKDISQISTTSTQYLLLKSIYYPLEILIFTITIYFTIVSLGILIDQNDTILNILFVIITIIITDFISRLISNFISRLFPLRNTKYSRSPKIVDKLLVSIVYIIALLIILRHFDIDITPLIAALGILGLSISLSMQDSVANLFAGLYLVSSSPIRVGDYIEINSEKVSGYVEDINWRETKIRTLSNTIIILPNTKISQSVVVNVSLPEKDVPILIECQVSPESDLDKVEKISLEVARDIQKNVSGSIKSFEPTLRYNNFSDTKISFTVMLMAVEYTDSFVLRHEFIKSLKREFQKQGIK